MTQNDQPTALADQTNPGDASPPVEPRARLWQTGAALLWEALGPALWAPLTLVGGFLALALFNPLPSLPGWLHAVLLVLWLGAVIVTAARGLRRLALPSKAEALRRLERDSDLPHRPLSTLRDRPAGEDPMAMALWRLHQERVRAALGRLRVSWPRSLVPSRDPFALRALVILLLVVAGGVGWDDWRPRLTAALWPHFDGGNGGVGPALDLWITPPDYTNLPPVFLKTGAGNSDLAATGQPLPVPTGSLVMARVSGGDAPPVLELANHATPFETVDAAAFQIQRPITGGTRIAVLQNGRTLGSWTVRVVPDLPPQIAHASPPAAGERGALRLDYAARDDYGLVEVKARIRPISDGQTSDVADGAPLDLPLALPGLHPKEARNSGFHDLTAHPWAGLPVAVRLIATDGAGQTGQSDESPLILPERDFHHPVARAIIEQRKILTRRPQAARAEVARALAEISARPSQYAHDLVAFLALRAAVARLMLDRVDAAAVPAVQALLWETALRVEDGGLSLAERDLREAERRLSEALDKGASDADLNQLMDELQAALDAFMNAMEQRMMEALQRGEQIPTIPPELADRMTDRNDLQQMLDRMREMAQTGSRDAARQMLSELQKMLEGMQSGAMAQQGQPNGQNDSWRMMQELQTLSQQQQQLLDQSFRQSQDALNQPPQQPGQQGPRGRQQPGRNSPGGKPGEMTGSPTLQKQAEQQEALRRQLGELMRRMGEQSGGEIPRPLGNAERAMRDAAQALQQGSPGAAVPSQTQAMDALQQGMQSMAEQLANQMARQGQGGPAMMGQSGQSGQPQPRPGRGRDPLGRRPSGMGAQDANDVKIPEQSELQRAREILDELRRRSGQYGRPQPERDYIDRLLKRF
jgi:uncharacterized protein (TIGR02302 family)